MKMLIAALAATTILASGGAHAACSVVAVTGNIQWYAGCSSDEQANDGDDLKMFVDKDQSGIQVIEGSLGSNDQSFDNVKSVANSDFETDGSGFANFKSMDAGQVTNTLTSYLFTPHLGQTLPDGTPYPGFDGQLFRGQIDDTGSFNGDLFVRVTFDDNTTQSHLYTGLSDKQDFGVLGFDEVPGEEKLVSSVFISLNSDGAVGGAFNEFKQIEFSVPGAIAAPEPSTWVMLTIGFVGLGFAAMRRKSPISIV